eukprot:CAMPEP_0113686064 /NCGR_PEP_ID=MMETSP0038_2-20120614/15065_1 /TAXON_ID=2898 /ORGANISM="Cryptomonas paramecium" /LENGTH=122 /DNA_ID=CAMNT_0000606311 /DNA_START=449 /DNA_END=813 /DNA_ORIENTATION=+ /assembly_acc=CAM_ASM_000170
MSNTSGTETNLIGTGEKVLDSGFIPPAGNAIQNTSTDAYNETNSSAVNISHAANASAHMNSSSLDSTTASPWPQVGTTTASSTTTTTPAAAAATTTREAAEATTEAATTAEAETTTAAAAQT